ncbi:MAG: hypothetical protein MRY49_02225 [Candidatus Pacebacteria bacterium]|nr:hypothetical protein [Candidatus Paceibacterota bacterium]
MLEYNEVKERKYIVWNREPYEVLSSHVFRKQQRKPVNQTKLKNLITGKVLENSFHQQDKVEEADIVKKKIKYLFNKFNRQQNVEEFWFSNPDDSSDRFALSGDIIGNQSNFMKQNEDIEALYFDEKVVGINLPINIALKVTEAVPAVAGNTAQGATKQVTVETGAKITVPLFIKEGDVLVVKTATGEYVGREN